MDKILISKKSILIFLVILVFFLGTITLVSANHCRGLACFPQGNNFVCTNKASQSPYYIATQIDDNLWHTSACEVEGLIRCDLSAILEGSICTEYTGQQGCKNPVDWDICVDNILCANVCRDHRCPTPSDCAIVEDRGGCADGSTCRVSHDWWQGISSVTQTCEGVWDAKHYACVYCDWDLGIKTRKIGDYNGLYVENSHNCNIWGNPIYPGSVCSSACGADPLCDERQMGDECTAEGALINCTSCKFAGKYCLDTCGGATECNYKRPGLSCERQVGDITVKGYCSNQCTCEIECPPGWANCGGDPNECETEILNDPNNCGGCGNSCSSGGTNINNSLNECVNGWCTCNSNWYRYGACTPTSQYSFNPPFCVDGSVWNSCKTQQVPFEGFSLHAGGSSRNANHLCTGSTQYVAKREFYYDSIEEKMIPRYTFYSCSGIQPYTISFALEPGKSYLVYPARSPTNYYASSFTTYLYPGWNFIGWPFTTTSDITSTIDTHLEGGFEYICNEER